jgi:hypothetical protein
MPLEDIFTGGSDWAKAGAVKRRERAISRDVKNASLFEVNSIYQIPNHIPKP